MVARVEKRKVGLAVVIGSKGHDEGEGFVAEFEATTS